MSKGSRNRTSDHQAYRDRWVKAFGGKTNEELEALNKRWQTIDTGKAVLETKVMLELQDPDDPCIRKDLFE